MNYIWTVTKFIVNDGGLEICEVLPCDSEETAIKLKNYLLELHYINPIISKIKIVTEQSLENKKF